jgi:hypothetical protein
LSGRQLERSEGSKEVYLRRIINGNEEMLEISDQLLIEVERCYYYQTKSLGCRAEERSIFFKYENRQQRKIGDIRSNC